MCKNGTKLDIWSHFNGSNILCIGFKPFQVACGTDSTDEIIEFLD